MRRRYTDDSIYITYSDMALLTLVIFIFLFTILVMTSKMTGGAQISKLKNQVEALQQKLEAAEKSKSRFEQDLEKMRVTNDSNYFE